MKDLGLIDGDHWQWTPRSIVPVDREDIANGFPGQPNPAWDTLDQDSQRDLARRMAVYAAMVESVDQGVGQIVQHLKQTGDLDNTPFRLYKHFTHEGRICSPLIIHWPKGLGRPNRWIRDPAHVMDIMNGDTIGAGQVR
jgi:arylsulfatase A-like enzyme